MAKAKLLILKLLQKEKYLLHLRNYIAVLFLTMKGNIILSVGFYPHSQTKAHGQETGCTENQKDELDKLHKRKIDLCDEVFVLNVDNYIGNSTRSEIEYAEKFYFFRIRGFI